MQSSLRQYQKNQGVIAGLYLIVMAASAGFAYGFAHPNLLAEDPVRTLQNLAGGQWLFYGELFAWVIIFIADLVVALALYKFFRTTSQSISMLTAMIRFAYTLVLGIAIWHLFRVLSLIPSSATDINATVALQVAAYFENFEYIWSSGLIIFGLHLVGLGYLTVRSRLVPKYLGWLLYLGGLSYTFIHSAHYWQLFSPDLIQGIEMWLGLPMALSEVLLAIWLLYYGFRKE